MMIAITMITLIVGCALTAILAVTTTILSSRLNCIQPTPEMYEAVMAQASDYKFIARTYPTEINP